MPRKPAPHADVQPVDPADRRRVFTVHLAQPGAAALRGRVVHLASGEAAYFESPIELVAVLIEMTTDQ